METLDNFLSPITRKSKLTLVNYLKGGIGNQLFQHVFGQSLAIKLGADLLYDISFFEADPYNNQSVLKLIAPMAEITEIAKLVGEGSYILSEGVLGSLSDQINLPDDAKVLALDGYWQNEQLLDRSVVSETYSVIAHSHHDIGESVIARDIVSHENSVAIHLRRRDYGHMGLCKESYYVGSIDFILKRFPDAKLYVFSDEPNFAQQFLGQRYTNTTMVSSGGDLADLYLMSLCKHFVIANSTYSWWAAYFAEDKGGLTICPKEWITLEGVVSPCPDRWIKVTNAVRAFEIELVDCAIVESEINNMSLNTNQL